jgi:hypothetical protein
MARIATLTRGRVLLASQTRADLAKTAVAAPDRAAFRAFLDAVTDAPTPFRGDFLNEKARFDSPQDRKHAEDWAKEMLARPLYVEYRIDAAPRGS